MLWIVSGNAIRIRQVQFDKHDKNNTEINKNNIYKVTLVKKAKQLYDIKESKLKNIDFILSLFNSYLPLPG
jgi:hypothetical protein